MRPTPAVLGLIDVIDSVDVRWSSVITTLLLALLTLAFVFAAQRCPDRRFSWLLSASVAAGLTIAEAYTLATTTPAACAAVVAVCIAVLIVRDLTGRRQPAGRRPPVKPLRMPYCSSRTRERSGAE